METSRVRVALSESEIDAAARHYTEMYAGGPATKRVGYDNFETADARGDGAGAAPSACCTATVGNRGPCCAGTTTESER